MQEVFVKVLNLSITSAWLILAVLCVRVIIKQIAPRWTFCLLWALVALCLVVPFSFESSLSIIPSREPIVLIEDELPPISNDAEALPEDGKLPFGGLHINSGFNALDNRLNAIIDSYTEKVEAKNDEAQKEDSRINILLYASYIWLAGAVFMIGYFTVNFTVLKIKLKKAIQYKENIYLNEVIDSPFLFGFIKPKIYLPIDISEESEEYVLAHENAHMKRFDHVIKPFGFLLLSIHWFNPLVWTAYVLLGRDIEYACDERVIKTLDETERKAYATALLECGVKAVGITCPVAFGEISVKSRILKTLNYKKPMLWVILTVILATAILAVAFLSSPKTLVKMDDEASVLESEESDAPKAEDVIGVWYTEGHSLMFENGGDGVCHSDGLLIPFKWTTDKKCINLLLSEEHKSAVELPTQTEFELSDDKGALTIGNTVYTSTYQSKLPEDIDSALVGTWYNYSAYSGESSLVLNADGSGMSGDTGISLFTWSAKDGSLNIKMSFNGMGYTIKLKDYKIDGDKLTFKYSGIKASYSKQRIELGGNELLLGEWNLVTGDKENSPLTFSQDGTINNDYSYYLWKEADGIISFYTVESSMTAEEFTNPSTAEYTIEGDNLTILYEGKAYNFTLEPNSRPNDVVKSDKTHPLGGDTAVVGKWSFSLFPDTTTGFLNFNLGLELKKDGTGEFEYMGVKVPVKWYTDESTKALAVYFENDDHIEDVLYGEYYPVGDALYVNDKGESIICFKKSDSDVKGGITCFERHLYDDFMNTDYERYVEIEGGECAVLTITSDISDFKITNGGVVVGEYDEITTEKPFGAAVITEEDAPKKIISFTDVNGNRISFTLGYTVDEYETATFTFEEMTVN